MQLRYRGVPYQVDNQIVLANKTQFQGTYRGIPASIAFNVPQSLEKQLYLTTLRYRGLPYGVPTEYAYPAIAPQMQPQVGY